VRPFRVEERAEVSTPDRSPLHDIPDDVFLTPLPKPEPTTFTYRAVWPLPALQGWWKSHPRPDLVRLTEA
jgi:hypothetical protein